MVLIIKKKFSKSIRQQVDEMLKKNAKSKQRHSWNKFFGKVDWSMNPVAYQRNLRDE